MEKLGQRKSTKEMAEINYTNTSVITINRNGSSSPPPSQKIFQAG